MLQFSSRKWPALATALLAIAVAALAFSLPSTGARLKFLIPLAGFVLVSAVAGFVLRDQEA
jgi:LPXTG-motif cell wall-anchored protein